MKRTLTLDDIRSRCEIIGDCWEWAQGAPNGCPQTRTAGRGVLVRRYVLELTDGFAVPRSLFVVSPKCSRLCCNPGHLKKLTGKQYMRWLNDKGAVNGPAQHAKRTACVRSRPSTKLTMAGAIELCARIAAGEDRGQVAAAFGISRVHANRVARGDQWADKHMPPASSVFAWAASS